MDNKTKLYSKILTAQKAIGYVKKNGKNTFSNYEYTTEGDLLSEVKTKANDAGLIFFTSAESVTGTFQAKDKTKRYANVSLNYTVADADTGESITGTSTGYAEDDGDKAVYKAITGASKYFLKQVFGVAFGDDPEKDEAHQQKYNQPVTNMNTPEQQANYKAEKQALIEEIKKLREYANLKPDQAVQIAGIKYSARDSIDTLTLVQERLTDFVERQVTNQLTAEDTAILFEGKVA